MIKKLIKILSLTSSESDGEALNAIRKANSLLKAQNITWADVIVEKITPKNDLDHIFEYIFTHLDEDEDPKKYSFVKSVFSYHRRGTITEKQVDAILNIYAELP